MDRASSVGNPKAARRGIGWKISLILLINSLSILMAIPVVYYQHESRFDPFLDYFWPAVVSAYDAQIFLLALWMAFGGTPRNGRHVLATALSILGLMTVNLICMWRELTVIPWSDYPLLMPMLFGPPFLIAAAMWSMHAMLLAPKWFYGITVDFAPNPHPLDSSRHSFGILQLFKLTIFVAIPCALAQLFRQIMGPEQAGAWAQFVFTPFMIFVSGLPIVAALLSTRLTPIWIGLALAWLALSTTIYLVLPKAWEPFHQLLMQLSGWFVVVINIIVLRILGVRWLQHATPNAV